jgi:hypothetical protein
MAHRTDPPYDFYALITPDKLDAMRHEVGQEDLTDLVVRSQRDADRGVHRARGAPVPLKRPVEARTRASFTSNEARAFAIWLFRNNPWKEEEI